MAAIFSEDMVLTNFNKLLKLANKFQCQLKPISISTNIQLIDESLPDYHQLIILCQMFGYVPIQYTMQEINKQEAKMKMAYINDKVSNEADSILDTIFESKTIPQSNYKAKFVSEIESEIKSEFISKIESEIVSQSKNKSKGKSKVKPEGIPDVKATAIVDVKPAAKNPSKYDIKSKSTYDTKPKYENKSNGSYSNVEIFGTTPKIMDFIMKNGGSFLLRDKSNEKNVIFSWDIERSSFKLSSNSKESFHSIKTLLKDIMTQAELNKKYMYKETFEPGYDVVYYFVKEGLVKNGDTMKAHDFMIDCQKDNVKFTWDVENGRFILSSKSEEQFNIKHKLLTTFIKLISDK